MTKTYNLAQLKLNEIKSFGIRLIACDYDGTVFDRNNKNFDDPIKVVKLIYNVRKAGLEFMLISARNATLEIDFRDLVSKFCKKKDETLTIWRSGGNGMNLSRITFSKDSSKTKMNKIYSNSISLNDARIALNIYKKLNIKPDMRSKTFFRKFLNKKLPEDLVPSKFLKIMKPFNGAVFAESSKISFILPSNKGDHKKIVSYFKDKLGSTGLNVSYSGLYFIDISKKLKKNNRLIDGKLLAINTAMNELRIGRKQVVTFGDSPDGNDEGLLSLPYSFTNNKNYFQRGQIPPFVLSSNKSPIDSIYDAINYLIE